MKLPFRIRNRKAEPRSRPHAGSSPALGYVETLTEEGISGWALDEGAADIRLCIALGEAVLPLDPQWCERADVAATHGDAALDSGFICTPPGDLQRKLASALDTGAHIRVMANGKELPLAKHALGSLGTLSWEPLDILLQDGNLQGCIEAWGGFALRGWLAIDGVPPRSMHIVLGEARYPLRPVWCERSDITPRTGLAEARCGFEIYLDGYCWESVATDAELCIVLDVEGHVLAPEGLQLSRARAMQWAEALLQLPEGRERRFRSLLALEHLRFGECTHLLSREARDALYRFAETMGLPDYLPPRSAGDAAPSSVAQTLPQRLQHWNALRVLNQRVPGVATPQQLPSTILEVVEDLNLQPEARALYLDSLVPYLCKLRLLHQIRTEEDWRRWLDYRNADDATRLCLALAALVARGEIAAAAEVLRKLGKRLDRGWINSECLGFAIEQVLNLARDGSCRTDVLEDCIEAFLAVLDGFRGEWFSRLHDTEIMRAAVRLLDGFDGFPDRVRRSVSAALLRNYGLSPAFWRELQGHGENPAFDDARAHWDAIREKSGEHPDTSEEVLGPTVNALRYFHRLGNPEAVFMLREIAAQLLPRLEQHSTPALRALFALLFEDPAEVVRLAASPLLPDGAMQSLLCDSGFALEQTLRELSPRERSAAWAAQRESGRLMRELDAALDAGDHAAGLRITDSLMARAVALNDARHGFLAADLLAHLLVCRITLKESPQQALDMLRRIVDHAIATPSALAAPLQSALARLATFATEDSPLHGYVSEMQRQLAQQFGAEYDFLFAAAARGEGGTGFAQDTLVVVYSCRRYLDSRINAIRGTWMADLAARGISCLVLVGDGDDRIHDDLLTLNVSDRYEDLPAKTLKLIDWVLAHTQYRYLYKIDDDCHLDVDRFFDALSWRKHHYYGRVIQRGIGNTDRLWHQSKSHSPHGQKALDKSPEPSIYADGGGGYSLSRYAMRKLQEAAQSTAGQRLVAVSLMEDKLVGDLLELHDITPSNEDYESYQRRRTHASAIPVGIRDNLFFPGLNTPTVMTHLDTEQDLARVQRLRGQSALWPKKLWPTCAPVLLAHKRSGGETTGSNQLELLSDCGRLADLLARPPVVICVVRNEMTLLPHFLQHYRRLGAKCFVFVDNLSDDGSREYLLQQTDVALFSADTDYRHSHYGVAWQQAVMGNLCLGRWVLLADADEFLVYPDCENRSLAEHVAALDSEGADHVRTDMIDMYPFGSLAEADFAQRAPFAAASWFDREPLIQWQLGSGQFSNTGNWLSALRHRIDSEAAPNAFTSQKYALLKYQPSVRLSQGIHCITGASRLSAQPAWFAHFKYHAGFADKVKTEIRRGQHFDNAREYQRYAAMLAESRGEFGREDISRQFESSASFGDIRY